MELSEALRYLRRSTGLDPYEGTARMVCVADVVLHLNLLHWFDPYEGTITSNVV